MSGTHINENELDRLLKEVFLQEGSGDAGKEASIVFAGDYDVTVDPAKESDLLNKLEKTPKGFGGYTFFLSSVLIVLAVCALMMATREQMSDAGVLVENHAGNNNDLKTPDPEKVDRSFPVQTIKVRKPRDTFARILVTKQVALGDSANIAEERLELKQAISDENELPVLTEHDRMRFANVKKQMLSKLYQLDEKFYAHVIADKMEYAGKTFITEAFNMKTSGVTNLEYKVFLADLLTQNRKEDFLKAQVQSRNWLDNNCDELALSYFHSDKYNDFPVVNITMEGAKLYCEWMEKELWTYMKQNKLKLKPIKLRLPFDYEWIYAARNGYSKIGFAEGYNTIFEPREGLMDVSSLGRMRLIRKRVKRNDTLYSYLAINHYGWDEKKLNELFSRAWNIYPAIPYDTLYAERIRDYGKFAHVPEMIVEQKSGRTWLIGTSWKSKEDYLVLENEFKAKGSSPFVGFRPVVINGNDPVYQNPFP